MCCMCLLNISLSGSSSQDGDTARLEGTWRGAQFVQDLGQAGPGSVTFDVNLSRR